MKVFLKIRHRFEKFLIQNSGRMQAKRLLKNKFKIIDNAKNKPTADGVIISFTTYEKRVDYFEYTILSILDGKILPEFVALYVTNDMLNLMREKCKIIFTLVEKGFVKISVVEDFKSYKKIVFALQQYSNKDIVICDDDVIYGKNWLKGLIDAKLRLKNDKVVIAYRCHKVKYKTDGTFEKYIKWTWNIQKEMSDKDYFPTGIGGVLYPANSLPKIAQEKELFLRLAPNADDVWLWFCARYNGCSFYKVKCFGIFSVIKGTEKTGLRLQNVTENLNDIQISNSYNFFLGKKNS